MAEWILAIVMWFIGLAGLHELPPPGVCAPVQGPQIIVNGEDSRRMWCVDSFGTMREQGGSR